MKKENKTIVDKITKQKTKDWIEQHELHKNVVNSCDPEGWAVPVSIVTLVKQPLKKIRWHLSHE